MNDDQIRSELERRGGGSSARPDWVRRDLLPAVREAIDTRPPRVTAGAMLSPRLSVLAVVAALLFLVVAVPRLGPETPAATPSTPGTTVSSSPSPSPGRPDAGVVQCSMTEALADPPLSLIDHSGLIKGCSMHEPQGAPDEVVGLDATAVPNQLAVSWLGPGPGCNPGDRLEFWPVEGFHSAADYLVLLVRPDFDPMCDAIGRTRLVDIDFTQPIDPADVKAIAMNTSDRALSSVDGSDSGFQLRLEAPARGLMANSPIEITSSLTYTGADPVTVSGWWQPDFGFTSLTGGPSLCCYGQRILLCPDTELQMSYDDTVIGRLEGPEAPSPEDPDYPYRNEYAFDGRFRLPAGTYWIYTAANFNLGPHCTGERVQLQTSIVIEVEGQTEPPTTPAPSPSAPSSPEPAAQSHICESADGSSIEVVDHSGLIIDCSMELTADPLPGSVPIVSSYETARLAVGWAVNMGCAADESMEFWGPIEGRANLPDYVLRVQRTTSDGAGCDEPNGRQVVRLRLTDSVRDTDIEAFWSIDGRGVYTSRDLGLVLPQVMLAIAPSKPEYAEGEAVHVTTSLWPETDFTVPCLYSYGIVVEQLDGPISFHPDPVAGPCPGPVDLRTAEPITAEALAAWGKSEPSPLAPWMRDGALYLPRGTYLFSSQWFFDPPDTSEIRARTELEAFVVVTVQ